MLRVALTGGIGSGKSTVAKQFATHNTPVLDADVIAHRLSEPGQPGYQAIIAHFGETILDAQQRIDRDRLGELIFNDEAQKARLERILHPRILSEIKQQLAALQNTDIAYCIIDIPLLYRRDQFDFIDRILVVDCPVEQQIQRTMQRDAASETAVQTIIAHQCSREQRRALADDILDNSGNLQTLEQAVNHYHQSYLKQGKL